MSLQKCVLENYEVEVSFCFSLESIIKMNCTLQKKSVVGCNFADM